MKITDRRIQKTKKAIDRAFWELMGEKGFDDISINDISNLADINRATFYHHYKDKYDWLNQEIDFLLADFAGLSKTISNPQDKQELHRGFLLLFQYIDSKFSFFSLLLKNKGTQFFQYRFKEKMVDILYSQITPENNLPLETDFVVQYVASVSVGMIQWWIENSRPVSVKKMADNLVLMYCSTPWANL